jgi:hypothetical protein
VVFVTVNTPFTRDSATARDLHFLGNDGIRLHHAMAGNYPRIPGVTLGLGLVHDLLLPVTHRLTLLVQSGLVGTSVSGYPEAEQQATCPGSDTTTRAEDEFCA